ncbi:unnamed protein product [Peniophora sp. CBMAI 1063]|nr:unnamed protein product [Peniophora sp. CBMAI 1063]
MSASGPPPPSTLSSKRKADDDDITRPARYRNVTGDWQDKFATAALKKLANVRSQINLSKQKQRSLPRRMTEYSSSIPVNTPSTSHVDNTPPALSREPTPMHISPPPSPSLASRPETSHAQPDIRSATPRPSPNLEDSRGTSGELPSQHSKAEGKVAETHEASHVGVSGPEQPAPPFDRSERAPGPSANATTSHSPEPRAAPAQESSTSLPPDAESFPSRVDDHVTPQTASSSTETQPINLDQSGIADMPDPENDMQCDDANETNQDQNKQPFSGIGTPHFPRAKPKPSRTSNPFGDQSADPALGQSRWKGKAPLRGDGLSSGAAGPSSVPRDPPRPAHRPASPSSPARPPHPDSERMASATANNLPDDPGPSDDVAVSLANLFRVVQNQHTTVMNDLKSQGDALRHEIQESRKPLTQESTAAAQGSSAHKHRRKHRNGKDGHAVASPVSKVDPELAEHPLYGLFLRAIRTHFKELMHVDDIRALDSDLLCCRSLTPEELDDFESRSPNRIQVTEEEYRFDFKLRRSHPFNLHSFSVFTQSFLRRVEAGEYAHPAPLPEEFLQRRHVLTAIYNHAKWIKSQFYRRFIEKETEEEKDDRLAAGARSSRKYRLYEKRLDAVEKQFPVHTKLMETAGVQGVSSDESSDELATDVTGQAMDKTFRISPAWRSAAFQNWQRSLDPVVRDLSRPRVGHRQKPGANPRHREVSTRVNQAAVAPSGLPRNCYDEAWLQTLHSHEMEELHMEREDYDLEPIQYTPTQPWYRRARRVPLSHRRRGVFAEIDVTRPATAPGQ